MFKKHFFFLIFGILLFSQCIPVQEEVLTDVDFNLSKAEFQRFYDLQDKQLIDSLLIYVDHKDPSYRYGAAMAFASIKDSSVVNSLAKLLEDDIEEVRTAAAYAMGQLRARKGESWLIKNFQSYDSLGVHNRFNAMILEAVGKCGSLVSLDSMCSTREYIKSDTLLLEGMVNGIYQFGLRNLKLQKGTDRMVKYLIEKGYPPSVRLIAANYLARIEDIKMDSFVTPLLEELFVAKDPDVRMALAKGLGKTKSLEVQNGLIELLSRERDYRVKCNIIHALGNYEYRYVVAAIVPQLEDKNIQVATSAANFFLNNGNPQTAPQYRQLARRNDSLNWNVKAILYQATNRHLSPFSQGTRLATQYELKDQFNNGNNYQKAAALRALGEYGNNYRDIYDLGFKSGQPVVRTACIQALANVASHMNFGSAYPVSRAQIKNELAAFFREALQNGDAAMKAEAAMVIRQPELDFKSIYQDSLEFLETSKNSLELPKEMETLYELLKTIDFFNGKDPAKTVLPIPTFNRPTNWRVFNTIDEDTKAEVKTSKGDFVIQFFSQAAPSTVTNFVSLAKSGFYDGKTFHRLVPNFVIQGGCPRGDGFGSLDYSIRSELPPLRYHEAGLVGAPSAGKHTEGVQLFITHAPTPHLNGKYTIFGKVIDGMNIVNQLNVGDLILSVRIVE